MGRPCKTPLAKTTPREAICCSLHCAMEMIMKCLAIMLLCGTLSLVATSSGALAQSATGADARLKERNITLPPVPSPLANYIDSVRVGNLLFLAGS